MTAMTESAIAALIVLGALFVLLGSIGLARLPDFLTRLHGPTKATTLGVGALLLASAIFFDPRGWCNQSARTGDPLLPVHHRTGYRASARQGGAAPAGQGTW